MPESWTGDLIGRMHNNKVTYDDLACEMGVSKTYISMLLNSHRKPPDIESRLENAYEKIMQRRGEDERDYKS